MTSLTRNLSSESLDFSVEFELFAFTSLELRGLSELDLSLLNIRKLISLNQYIVRNYLSQDLFKLFNIFLFLCQSVMKRLVLVAKIAELCV